MCFIDGRSLEEKKQIFGEAVVHADQNCLLSFAQPPREDDVLGITRAQNTLLANSHLGLSPGASGAMVISGGIKQLLEALGCCYFYQVFSPCKENNCQNGC